MSRVISASLSPNTEIDDVFLAWSVLFRPHIWSRGDSVDAVTRWFRERYHPTSFFSFTSGRIALYALLHAFHIKKNDEVIVQAFTCVAVPNSVRWVGATPIYVDIDETFNISPEDLEKKITDKTKVIIVQHTFGIPANMDAITKIAKNHHLLIIEDCAHALGGTYHGKKLGTLGDAAFFSFGRDKVLSSVWGGAAMINGGCPISDAGEKLKKFHTSLPYASLGWTVQQIFHPIAFSWILPLYKSGMGKLLLVIFQALHFLSFPVLPEEKNGKMPTILLRKYPNGLALLLLKQLKKLSKYSKQRKEACIRYESDLKKYDEITLLPLSDESIPLRFPIYVEHPEVIREKAKKNSILLGNWYHHTIDPEGVRLDMIGYTKGSCPKAEKAAQHCVNLPTRIQKKELERILVFFRTI